MTHQEFTTACHERRLRVRVDAAGAARLVSAHLMLPFVLLPLLGLAVALALAGYIVLGIALFLAAIGFRALVRRTSAGFVLQRALEDERFYEQARASGLLTPEEKK